ncbi:MAG: hypothetical protein IJJ11_06575 [Methanosphaera sp.]|nr:hypothetical protein [Methanosphaera sp.]
MDFDLINIEHLYDLEYVLGRFAYKIDEYIDDEVVIDCTFSTDIMNLAAILMADRYNKVIQKNIFPIDINKSRSNSQKNCDLLKLQHYFNHNAFQLMNELLDNTYKMNNSNIKLYRRLASDYSNWDNFNYESISNRRYSLDFPEYSEEFLNNQRALQKILDPSDKRHFPYQIADMLNNAKRRYVEGKYNDAVMRLYRTMDIIAHAELLTKYGVNKSNIDVNLLTKLGIKRKYISKIENQHRSRTTSKEIEINLTEGYFLLYRLNNKIGRYYYKNIELFTRLNRIRNKSILNHGKASLTSDDYNEYETVTLEVARMFSPIIDRYMAEVKFPRFKIDDDKKYFL